MIDTPYKGTYAKINKKTINNFKLSRFKRKQTKQHVLDIVKQLKKGEHFHMPLLVFYDNKDEKYEILDGNHRLNAIKRMIDYNDNFCINVTLFIYDVENKTKREMYKKIRGIYHNVNSAKSQTSDDYLEAYKDTIPFISNIKETEIPCAIYSTNREIKMSLIIKSIHSYRKKMFRPSAISRKDLVDFAKTLTKEDVAEFSTFWYDFKKMFNISNSQNFYNEPYTKTTGFMVMYYIWKKNKDNIGRKQIIKDVRKKLANTKSFNDMARDPGMTRAIKSKDEFVRILNSKKQGKKYKY